MRIDKGAGVSSPPGKNFNDVVKDEAAKFRPTTGGPIPVEPDGGIGDGAGPIPEKGGPDATTLALGEEDGGGDGGPIFTTLAVGEEDGGGSDQPPVGGDIIGSRCDDVLEGSDGDDRIRARAGDDIISTGQGDDRVRGGRGDDLIAVTGSGDKRINGGSGHDTLELKGQEADYAIQHKGDRTIYTAQDGSRIVARNIETVRFTGVTPPPPPPVDPGFIALYELEPNALGVTSLSINGDTAVLKGPDIDFTFTGVDPSGLAVDGPIIATGGSGTINGEETTAVALSPFGDAVLTIGSGFNPTGTQAVNAAFANGAMLNTTVAAVAVP